MFWFVDGVNEGRRAASSIKKFKNFFNYGVMGYEFGPQSTNSIHTSLHLSSLQTQLTPNIDEMKLKFALMEWNSMAGEEPPAHNQQTS